LFGTTGQGGAHGEGTVFEIVKTAHGYASAPTDLVSFCALANCADGRSPEGGLIADAKGNLFGTTALGGVNEVTPEGHSGGGTVFEIVKTAHGYASAPTTLVRFCSLPNCADGELPTAFLIADSKGNLFGTTSGGGTHDGGTVFEIVKTADGYASTPTTLVSFCSLPNCADGRSPEGGLIADANGNLFGTTGSGGVNGLTPSGGGTPGGGGTLFEVVKTADGYANTPTVLVSFCALANCADGRFPNGLIADAKGNLFGTTTSGGVNGVTLGGGGTVFEISGSGFAVNPMFAGTPGKPKCFGKSVLALAGQYGGLNAAAAALGYPSVRALQEAIMVFCEA
jgi:hypothetical protein